MATGAGMSDDGENVARVHTQLEDDTREHYVRALVGF
jgi:hypothetical protein